MAKDSPVGMIIGLGVAAAAAWALYEWLSTQCTTSTSSLYGGSLCSDLSFLGFGTPAAAISNTTSSSTSSGSTSGSGTPAVTQTTAKLTNLTAPGQPYAVGDSFQLVISGPPNQPVTGSASQNGAVSSSTNFGTTNSAGQLVITGTWGASDAGTWLEAWQVGNSAPAAVNFTIGGGSAPSPVNGTCPAGYAFVQPATGFPPVPNGAPICSPIAGVSGIGYINRIPRGFINRRRTG
jgi:hypothetical protein